MNAPKCIRRPRARTLLRLAASVLFVTLAVRAPSTVAQAVVARRPVQAGEVTGLEMAIEGDLRAPRGGRVRWLVTVYDVVGLSELRPAPRARVRVLSSLVRDRAVQEVTTDALGRAEVGVEVPLDAPAIFHVVLEAINTRNVRRQFDLDVQADPGRVLTLEADRLAVLPGRTFHVWGRLASAVTGSALPGTDVIVEFSDTHGRAAAPRARLRTDAAGGFAHTLRMPDDAANPFTVRASVGERERATSATLQVMPARLTTPAMIVRAATDRTVVVPREEVQVDVVVRTGDGRPVRNALVTSPMIPRPAGTTDPVYVRTDARGRTQFRFGAPEVSANLQDVEVVVSAERAGIGTATGVTHVRVARERLFATTSVEGGALVPGLPGKVYVRVVGADGQPAPAGVSVVLSGPRLPPDLRATTDADGVAVIDTVLTDPNARRGSHRAAARSREGDTQDEDSTGDSCGGLTATSYTIALSRGEASGSARGCLAVDPDATVRVRVAAGPFATAGTPLRATLLRAPAVMHVPIEVALVAVREGRLVPFAARVVPAGTNDLELDLPPESSGQVLIRARPLVGPLAQAVRGGVASVWVVPDARFSASARAEQGGERVIVDVATQGAAPGALEGTVVVLPRDEGEALIERIRARGEGSPLGDLRVALARAGEALVAGALAARTPLDDAAPAVLRAGRLTPMPAPERPIARGTLRDPWRASARFVEGRLAGVFRAIEEHVEAALPGRRDDVALRGPGGRWEFNREIFDAISSHGVGREDSGARGLGGAPLTIETLQQLDPAFTYDNVARRITRRRMFALLLALRRFVNAHALDLRWSWHGDPSSWLRSLPENDEGNDEGEQITRAQMVDGWGTPFELRAAPGGRARFGFLAPVPGYELVSAGPDERFGTADDVYNPFARVLPSGSAYARAVDEDGLVARLAGVELGRATLSRLAEVFGIEDAENEGSDDDHDAGVVATSNWSELPSVIERDPHALDLVRPGLWAEAQVQALARLAPGTTQLSLRVDDEPRTYALVIDAWSASGSSASTISRFAAGTPVIVDLPLASNAEERVQTTPRLRAGEPLRVTAAVTNLSERAQSYAVIVRGEGPVEAVGSGSLEVPAGEVGVLELDLRGRAAGPGAVLLALRDAQGLLLREVRAPVRVDHGGLAMRDDVAGGLEPAASTCELGVRVPAAARVESARLVITAPSAIADDPEMARVRRLDPALVAWSYTLASRALPADLAAGLYRAQLPSGEVRPARPGHAGDGEVWGASPALSTACALVAWSAMGEDDTRATLARVRAAQVLPSISGTMGDMDSSAGALREAAAVLTALATGAQGALEEDDENVDPVAAHAERLRQLLRGALRTFEAQPTLLARAAAALLLTDPSDERGIALFETARRAIERAGDDGALVRGGQGRRGEAERLTATAALAIAAQQRGETNLARRLARTLAARAHRAMRLGGEETFWLLAAAGYGVYGLGAPEAVDVTIDGATRRRERVRLDGGRAIIPVDVRAGAEVRASLALAGVRSSGPTAPWALARLEVLYERDYMSRGTGPLRLSLDGDVGYAGEVSALELTVRNTGDMALDRAVVEIQLPAGARFDEAARAALLHRPGVTAVELRDGALVRVALGRIGASQSVELPLAPRWLARGRVTGFGAVAYTEEGPSEMAVLPPRVVELIPRPEE